MFKKAIDAMLFLVSMLVGISFPAVVSAEQNDNVDSYIATTAFVTKLTTVEGKLYGWFDEVEWYVGVDADREFVKDCDCQGEMNHARDGYFIRNTDPEERALLISEQAEFVLQTRDLYNIKWNERVTREQFLQFAEERGDSVPYHLEITDGIVTKITEQYIP